MEILCANCGRMLSLEQDRVGRDVRCPYCGNIVHVPAMGDESTCTDAPTESHHEQHLPDEFVTKAKLLLQKKLLVVCGSCGERLTVDQRLEGKTIQCPSCGSTVDVPTVSAETMPLEDTGDLTQTGQEGLTDFAQGTKTEPIGSVSSPSASIRLAKPSRNIGWGKWLVVIILAAGLGISTVYIGYTMSGSSGDKGIVKPDIPSKTSDTDGHKNTPSARAIAATIPTRPSKPVVVNIQPAVKLVDVSTTALADNGIPAKLGKVFLYVSCDITAGSGDLKISPVRDVSIDCKIGQIPPLGVADENLAILQLARNDDFVINARKHRRIKFVFVIPEGISMAMLRVEGVKNIILPGLTKPFPISLSGLVGNYSESARYLKLEFDNPIMERFRLGPPGRLIIRKHRDQYKLFIPQIGMRGIILQKDDDKNEYPVILSAGGDTLRCRFRAIDSGKRIILYLSNKPYHQLIYSKKE